MSRIRSILVSTIIIVAVSTLIPLAFQFHNPTLASGLPRDPPKNRPAVADAVVKNFQTNIGLPAGASLYLYGLVTGGGYPSTEFASGNKASIFDADEYLIASLAVTTDNADSYTTQTFYPAIGGVSVSGFSTYTSFYGSNNSAAASSASVTFAITRPRSLVVVIGDAGGEQSIALSGLRDLSVDATNFNGVCNQGIPPVIWIGHAYPAPGHYTVTERTSQCAAGQDPNHAGDLIGVFIFTPSSPSPPEPEGTPPSVFLLQPFIYGTCVSINGVMNPTTPSATLGPASWSWGDGSTSISWFPATHTYTATGTYLVRVTATDSNGLTGTASTTVNVNGSTTLVPPQLTISTPTVAERTITVNGVANSNACAGPLQPFTFNWGDGTVTMGSFPQSHTYTSPGNFQLCVTATDSFGASTTKCESASVQ